MLTFFNVRVLKNYVSLAILQAGNYLLPLLLIPYLIRALGIEMFGNWAFAITFTAMSRTVVNYGFDLTATKAVSTRRSDRAFLSHLYFSIVLVRLCLLILCCGILVALSFLVPPIYSIIDLSLVSMLVLVGESLFPVWLFQGMEQMSIVTKLRLGYRCAFVALVFGFVNSPREVLLVPIIETATSLAAGLSAIICAVWRYKVSFLVPRLSFLVGQLRSAGPVFVSFVAAQFYSTINIVALGVMVGPVPVAHYSVAEKAYSAVRGMLGPAVQALFPVLSRTYSNDYDSFHKGVRKLFFGYVITIVLLAIAVFMLSPWIVLLISGTVEQQSLNSLRLLAISLCFSLGTLLSPLLVIREKGGVLVRITFATMFVNCLAIVPLIQYYGTSGVALAFLLTQGFQSLLQVFANSRILFHRTSLNT